MYVANYNDMEYLFAKARFFRAIYRSLSMLVLSMCFLFLVIKSSAAELESDIPTAPPSPSSLASAVNKTSGSQPKGICHLPWPKFGDTFVFGSGVYVMFFCELHDKDSFLASTAAPTIEYDISTLGITQNQKLFVPIRSRRYVSTRPFLSQSIADDLIIDMTDERAYTSISIHIDVFINGHFIDSAKSLVLPASQEYFDITRSSASALVGNQQLRCDFDTATQRCDASTMNTLAPRRYDFVEIGTSNFATLIEAASDRHVGLSVEVMKDLQDTLPDRAGVIKVNAAIGDESGWSDIYYYPKKFLDFLGVVNYDRGMYGIGRIGGMQKTIADGMVRLGVDSYLTSLATIRREMVKVIPVGQLLAEYGVASIGFLKVDTEGFDNRILSGVLDYLEARPEDLEPPAYIMFENNSNSTGAAAVAKRLVALGYRVYNVVEISEYDGGKLVFGDIYAEHPRYAVNVEIVDGMIPRLFKVGRDNCRRYIIDEMIARNPNIQWYLDMHDRESSPVLDEYERPAAYYCQVLIDSKADPENEVLDVSKTFHQLYV